jgi:hypothetical protein
MTKEEEKIIEEFLNEICAHFPEIKPLMDKHEDFMNTSKMEEFANATTRAFGRENTPDRGKEYLEYMSKKLDRSKPIEHKFIDTYYVENLFWDSPKKYVEIGWQHTPNNLKRLYVNFHGKEPH